MQIFVSTVLGLSLYKLLHKNARGPYVDAIYMQYSRGSAGMVVDLAGNG